MIWGPYRGRILDWHDGDTVHLDLDLGFGLRVAAYTLDGHPELSCRIWGINTPELSTDAGKDARAAAERIAPPGTIVQVVSHDWDKYGGRFDGTLTLPDGSDYGARMIEGGYAEVMRG
jgi:endonuclease YncB( thermonuclease family)